VLPLICTAGTRLARDGLQLPRGVVGQDFSATRRASCSCSAAMWGLHRPALAVLGPIQDPANVIELLSTNKLGCWGVSTIASGADVYVIPRGYREL
jgi:hypothetical protein